MKAPGVGADELARRVAHLRARIEAAGGDPDRTTIVGVTKGFAPEVVPLAIGAGLVDLGESYAQEAVDKFPLVGDEVAWHWIGRMQRNKVRLVADRVGLWHSVDRASLGAEIAKRAPGAAVLVQLNTSGEASKGGCPPGDAPGLVADLRAAGLDVRGLMTIAAPDPDAARVEFRALRTLADDLGLPERSMGMSADLDAAVAEGATIVRVGTALFGARTGA